MKIIGFVLIVVGSLMLIFKGINYTQEKKLVDIGPIQINKMENKRVVWPLYAGGIALVAGIVLVAADKKAR